MIKKSIILCISLFLIYTLFIYFLAPKWWTASQHQWQENIVKAQQFSYNKETFQNIIVGSSLSSRLIMDSIPETYNLSFAGQSIFDGLNIVCNSNKSIKNVFIEINLLFVLYLDKPYCDCIFIYLIYCSFLSLGTDIS